MGRGCNGGFIHLLERLLSRSWELRLPITDGLGHDGASGWGAGAQWGGAASGGGVQAGDRHVWSLVYPVSQEIKIPQPATSRLENLIPRW